jgi:hypothetical protein
VCDHLLRVEVRTALDLDWPDGRRVAGRWQLKDLRAPQGSTAWRTGRAFGAASRLVLCLVRVIRAAIRDEKRAS